MVRRMGGCRKVPLADRATCRTLPLVRLFILTALIVFAAAPVAPMTGLGSNKLRGRMPGVMRSYRSLSCFSELRVLRSLPLIPTRRDERRDRRSCSGVQLPSVYFLFPLLHLFGVDTTENTGCRRVRTGCDASQSRRSGSRKWCNRWMQIHSVNLSVDVRGS